MRKWFLLAIGLLLFTTPAIAQNGVVWKAEFYGSPYLIGERVRVESVNSINFDWGLSSPDDLPDDGFSIRFTTDAFFAGGTYRFSALADDRVRVSVAFAPVIDTFNNPQPGTLLSAEVPLPPGQHHIQIDYAEEVREAYILFNWAQIDANPNAPELATIFTSAPALTPNPWQAAYYDNPNLSEPFKFKRDEPSATRTFGTNPPREDLPADNFSVRWESIQPLDDGQYQMRVRADDGVRVYINGNRVIDQWHQATGQIYTHTFIIPKGEYRFTVEYYDSFGNGFVEFNLVTLDDRPVGELYTLQNNGPASAAPAPVNAAGPPTGYQITAADFVSIRSGPARTFAKVGVIPFEAQANVLARDAGSNWWQVDYNGVVGWVNAQYGRIQPDANINQIPVAG